MHNYPRETICEDKRTDWFNDKAHNVYNCNKALNYFLEKKKKKLNTVKKVGQIEINDRVTEWMLKQISCTVVQN